MLLLTTSGLHVLAYGFDLGDGSSTLLTLGSSTQQFIILIFIFINAPNLQTLFKDLFSVSMITFFKTEAYAVSILLSIDKSKAIPRCPERLFPTDASRLVAPWKHVD